MPLRRVNSRYVIATSKKVDLAGVDSKKIDEVAQPKYFVGEKSKEKKTGEEAFFKQGEKPEVRNNPSIRRHESMIQFVEAGHETGNDHGNAVL